MSATAQQYVAIYIEEETTQRYFEFVTVKSNESNQIVDFHIYIIIRRMSIDEVFILSS